MDIRTRKYKDKLCSKIDKSFSQYGDSVKKIALKLAWWNIKFIFHSVPKQTSFYSDSIQHIGIYVAGGIGDLICAGKYIQSLSLYLGDNIEIDVVGEDQDIDSLNTIFHEQNYIHTIIPIKEARPYDLQIQLIRFPVVITYDAQRLSAKTLHYVEAINEFHKQNPLLIKSDFLGRCYSQMFGRKRENQADIDNILNMSAVDFSIHIQENDILKRLGLEIGKFITVQTGAGVHFQQIPNEVRQWPLSYYTQLIKELKKHYQEYKILQLGEGCQEPIPNVDMDLRGKTSLTELFSILKASKLHISQEGGMPIIRHIIKGGPSVVLFGPTDENFFGFEENINITARKCPHPCEWITKDWMSKCLKAATQAECMQLITPEKVLKEIKAQGAL